MLRITPTELDNLREFDAWGMDDLPRNADDDRELMPFDDYDPWEVA